VSVAKRERILRPVTHAAEASANAYSSAPVERHAPNRLKRLAHGLRVEPSANAAKELHLALNISARRAKPPDARLRLAGACRLRRSHGLRGGGENECRRREPDDCEECLHFAFCPFESVDEFWRRARRQRLRPPPSGERRPVWVPIAPDVDVCSEEVDRVTPSPDAAAKDSGKTRFGRDFAACRR
jgi:hypothetical protein